MVSLRFPLSFSQPPTPKPPNAPTSSSFSTSATAACSFAAVCGAGIVAGLALSQTPASPLYGNAFNSLLSNLLHNTSHFSPMWGSVSLTGSSASVAEPKTGMSFPSVLKDSQRLLGIGLRKKAVLGLKNIDVYAFGVYADDGEIKKVLTEKYGALSAAELKEKKELREDLMESDISMTIRLQIVYGRLSIQSVRSAFKESVGNRLRKFGGSNNKELLERFTSQFKDEYKIPRESIIDLSRDQGYVLRTTIDGQEVGSIQSKPLCRSIIDLYIGDEPFDHKAKEDVQKNLAHVVQK